MPNYVLIEEQNNGCDYTIGCGFRITPLRSETMEDAIKEVIDLDTYGNWKEYIREGFEQDGSEMDFWCDCGLNKVKSPKQKYKHEYQIDNCYILEVTKSQPMMAKMTEKRAEVEEYIDSLTVEYAQKKKREEYEKMKKEFGD